MITVRVVTTDAIKYLVELHKLVQQVPRIFVGSDLVYAYGIEYGVTKSGRLARRAGGAFYLKGALDEIQGRVGSEIVNGLASGNLRNAFLRLGLTTVTFAQARVPVRTGSLRRSIHMVEE